MPSPGIVLMRIMTIYIYIYRASQQAGVPPAASRTPVMVEDVADRDRKCDSTAKGCIKKHGWARLRRERQNGRYTLHPTQKF